MDLYFLIFALVTFLEKIEALRCYAGNPSRRHECNSLSYCLVVTSRTGRSQWSCDGNAYSQVSLCSNLGMDTSRHTIYEAPPVPARDSFFQNADPDPYSRSNANKNERMYFIKQQIDPRLSQFVDGSGTAEGNPEPAALSARKNGKRCFDAGDLGKICCCSTDFCNGVPESRVLGFSIILPLLIFFRII
ncbi:hypothetical protein FO519_002459 [Halicephalobus sp. NKZ332]|nr:hypothetical protein FO519_002459 [Halicephalobus sp. NKZ332]